MIYNCFVDRSKYSVVDMLKELVVSYISRNSIIGYVGKKVKLIVVNVKLKEGKSLLYLLGDGSNNVKLKILSYCDYVKNIRCNFFIFSTICILIVNFVLKVLIIENKKISGF